MQPPIVQQRVLLQKFPGKGGWTYAALPGLPLEKSNPFGWLRVKGTIDGYAISQYHLMPMGNGALFLPVKAAIRKKIGKQAGDEVMVVLYPDNSPVEIPADLEESLQLEPAAHEFFHSLKQGEQKEFINWIYSSKRLETQAMRISRALQMLLRGQRTPRSVQREH